MRLTLRRLTRLVGGDITSSMTLLADARCDAVDRWRVQLQYPPNFRCLGLGAWLAHNGDDVDSAVVAQSSLNVTSDALTAVYAALTGCPDLINNLSCLHLDENSTSFPTTPMSDFISLLPSFFLSFFLSFIVVVFFFLDLSNLSVFTHEV